MTNEKLALLAQQGDTEARNRLYEQNQGLLFNLMRRYFTICQRYGSTEEDLMQQAFFAIVLAVEAYDPAKGLKFATYLNHSVKRAVRGMLQMDRRKGEDYAPVPLSLNAPITAEEISEIVDTLEDEAALQPFEDVEAVLYRQKLHSTLEVCMAEKLDERQAELLRKRYYHEKTQPQLSEEMGISVNRVRELQNKALVKLAMDKRLREYREDIITRHAYNGGPNWFKNHMASSVEWTVERLMAM